ncbi:MAG: HEAT repeat domain-containing protein [Desulfatitalea sp.]|nr:HEAT repeat domain-containing protein [Desulfatitalea sp.]NNK02056.1 HEAT repeat domain-containing protein [Desulfatitalea sp.]
MSNNVIPFNANERLLIRARAYLTALDRLLADGEEAVDVLINALPYAEDDLKLKIVLMLGTLPFRQVVWALYQTMVDADQHDTIRHAAAIQLSQVAGQTWVNDTLVESLVADLGHPDPVLRANAAFALGWEGNQRAVLPLVDALRDNDPEVQQAAVSALTNIRDDRLFDDLADRLLRGAKEQQRSIIYHMGVFTTRREDAVRICKRFLSHKDPDLRYDALVVLDAVSDGEHPLHLYMACLRDEDQRVREQALQFISNADEIRLEKMVPHLHPLLTDHSAKIRQAATRLLNTIRNGPVAV